MLLVGTADPEVVDQFLKFVPRIVIVDNRDPQNSHDCVITDGFNGARLAVSHLLKMGHRRIGFLKSRQLDVSFCDRLNGYLCTLFQAGLELDRSLIWEIDEPEISTDMSAEVGQITNYLKDAGDNRPTGIVAVNDAHALALLHACRLMRISVPNEMSIVGFDDTDFSAHTFPALTTVRVDKEEMGRMAVRRLHRRMTEDMDGAGSNPAVVVQLPVALIERSSSGMAPAAR
jgi:LacI family transcriptional regulator